MEIWVPVAGYEGKYMVSSYGRVLGLARKIKSKRNSLRHKGEKMLVLCKRNGYVAITLGDGNGNKKQVLVHRLVATTFIPNPEQKPQVNHKDGDKKNNRIENLEWSTPSENGKHAYAIGLNRVQSFWTGTLNQNGSCKPVRQLSKDGKLIKVWPTASEVERQLGFLGCAITQACRGRIKTSRGYKWEYA
jgi:hypothetical protein